MLQGLQRGILKSNAKSVHCEKVETEQPTYRLLTAEIHMQVDIGNLGGYLFRRKYIKMPMEKCHKAKWLYFLMAIQRTCRLTIYMRLTEGYQLYWLRMVGIFMTQNVP